MRLLRFLLVAPLLGGAVPLSAQQTERRALGARDAAVYNLAGRVEVGPASGSEIVVEIRRGGRDAERLRVATGQIGGKQSLRVQYPGDDIVYPALGRSSRTTLSVRDDGTFGDRDGRWDARWGGRGQVSIRGSGSGTEAWADLRVLVPAGANLTLHLAVGEVTISNVNGALDIDTHSARITADRTRGSLRLDSGSGRLEVRDAEGAIDLDTGSGGVSAIGVRGPSLRIDTGSGGVIVQRVAVHELNIDTGSGGVRASEVEADRIDIDTGSGGAELELLRDVDDVRIDTGSGGVTLSIPASVGATLDIETGSGGIRTDFPIRVRSSERGKLLGEVGDGRGRIKIEAGSGTVQLRRR